MQSRRVPFFHRSQINFWSDFPREPDMHGFIKITTFQRRGYFFRNSAPRDSSLPLKMETERKNSRDRCSIFVFQQTQRDVSDLETFRRQKFSTTNIFADKTPLILLLFFFSPTFSKRSPFQQQKLEFLFEIQDKT